MDDYLTTQGVIPYIVIGDRYRQIFDRMLNVLEFLAADELDQREAVAEMQVGTVGSTWHDTAAKVSESCVTTRRPVPTEVDEEMILHIAAINAWNSSLRPNIPLKP